MLDLSWSDAQVDADITSDESVKQQMPVLVRCCLWLGGLVHQTDGWLLWSTCSICLHFLQVPPESTGEQGDSQPHLF